jgi:hypothetical protein
MNENDNFEEGLMKHLSSPGLETKVLKDYSSILARIQKQKFKIERIWWDGQPAPDVLIAQTRVSIKNMANLGTLFQERLKGLEIFPLGIPFPEELLVNIRIPK